MAEDGMKLLITILKVLSANAAVWFLAIFPDVDFVHWAEVAKVFEPFAHLFSYACGSALSVVSIFFMFKKIKKNNNET